MANTSVQTVKTPKGDLKLSPEIVKKYLVNGNGSITDSECAMFLALCKYQNLNPFLKEVYLIKYGISVEESFMPDSSTRNGRPSRSRTREWMPSNRKKTGLRTSRKYGL